MSPPLAGTLPQAFPYGVGVARRWYLPVPPYEVPVAGLAIGIVVLAHEVLLLPPGGVAGRVLVPPLLLVGEVLHLRVQGLPGQVPRLVLAFPLPRVPPRLAVAAAPR